MTNVVSLFREWTEFEEDKRAGLCGRLVGDLAATGATWTEILNELVATCHFVVHVADAEPLDSLREERPEVWLEALADMEQTAADLRGVVERWREEPA